MSLHTQLLRGLLALPAAVLLAIASAIAPHPADAPARSACTAPPPGGLPVVVAPRAPGAGLPPEALASR